eukprot:TRINITY_DN11787_c0_g1_i1.p1 TRINITY_DN11787_c0_g1~~TRINITY_DN11787_c0_g1_i1.p1  ORF type:complete len:301 (-),score=0.16 TRINITY_DN11787_c0_g1_i1:205-1059(-)
MQKISSKQYIQTAGVHPVTQGCRIIVVLAILIVWSNYAVVNNCIQQIYDVLRNNIVFKHDSFEPGLSSASFTVWINVWYIVDAHFHSQRKWRLQKSDSLEAYSYVGGMFREMTFTSYLLPLMAFDYIYPRRNLPVLAPTAFQLVFDVLACLFVYDFLFFWVHILYHKVPFFYKYFHAKHHVNLLQRSIETVRLAIPEIVLNVTCSIIAVNVTGAHPLSRAIYNAYLVYYLTELHSGYDMPWMLANVVPFGLWGGAKYHDVHHRVPTVYYQKVFTYLDRLCGFVP